MIQIEIAIHSIIFIIIATVIPIRKILFLFGKVRYYYMLSLTIKAREATLKQVFIFELFFKRKLFFVGNLVLI